jgi:predicted nucleic acid-binding protein
MRADFSVVLDACVLAEAAVSDLFLRLSEEPRLLLPRWSEAIWEETRRTWVEKFAWDEVVAASRIQAATGFFPEAMIEGYEYIIPKCQNHPKDRYVLAAAIHSNTETIVTFNVRDFSSEALAPWGIKASHPADYLKVLFDHDPAAVTNALHSMASKAQRTVPELLGRLAWYVRPFSEYVSAEYASELPEISPQDWRRFSA